MAKITIVFAELPRTTRSFPGKTVVNYIRPSRMTRAGWDPGSEWETPTSLSFETESMATKKYRAIRKFNLGMVIPPVVLMQAFEDQWNDLIEVIDEEERVVERGTEVGFRFDIARDFYTISELEAKTWPSIPGVTVPKEKEL